jgi:pentatricopeptide repeat protein
MMCLHKVAPNLITFGAVISALARGGQWEKALDLFHSMKVTYRLNPDITSFNAVIHACEKSDQWRKALEVFQEMLQCRVIPDNITFSLLVRACERSNQWEKILELLTIMKQTKQIVVVDEVIINVAIQALDTAHEYESAMEVLKLAHTYELYDDLWTKRTEESQADYVDLHLCTSAVARTVLRLHFTEVVQKEEDSLCDIVVITGKGKHSVDGTAVLPVKMREFCDSLNIKVSEIPLNPGRFKIEKAELIKAFKKTK